MKIWSVWRKSGLTVVFVITGVSVPEVNIPRLPAVEDVLLVSQKRNKYYENKTVVLEKTLNVCLIIAGFSTYFCYVVTKVRCGVCFLTAILHRGLRNDSLNVTLLFLYYFWTYIQFSLDLSFWIFISHFNLFSILSWSLILDSSKFLSEDLKFSRQCSRESA